MMRQMLICLKMLKLESRGGGMRLTRLQRRKPGFMMISKILFLTANLHVCVCVSVNEYASAQF